MAGRPLPYRPRIASSVATRPWNGGHRQEWWCSGTWELVRSTGGASSSGTVAMSFENVASCPACASDNVAVVSPKAATKGPAGACLSNDEDAEVSLRRAQNHEGAWGPSRELMKHEDAFGLRGWMREWVIGPMRGKKTVRGHRASCLKRPEYSGAPQYLMFRAIRHQQILYVGHSMRWQ